jgi:hypothetical protein
MQCDQVFGNIVGDGNSEQSRVECPHLIGKVSVLGIVLRYILGADSGMSRVTDL